jgi:tetratricopeptide (TPR) repeat protein
MEEMDKVREHFKVIVVFIICGSFMTILVGIFSLKGAVITAIISGGLVLLAFAMYQKVKKEELEALSESRSTITVDNGIQTSKGFTDIAKLTNNLIDTPLLADEDVYVRRCLQQEFKEELETRKWNSDSAFNSVLFPYNSQQFGTAIENGEKLISKFNDFDLLYKWIGDSYRNLSQFKEAYKILVQGLLKAKRKSFLLTSLSEIEWRTNSFENAIYFLSQAIHCLHLNEIDINAYLLMHYIAKGQELDQESHLFLQHVDKLRAGQIRLSPDEANRLVDISGKNKNEIFKRIIKELCNKYLR